MAFVGKAEYTDNPITNWLFCGAGMIPVRREDPSDLPHVFEEVAEVLERGEVIGVFPEGTRSRDGCRSEESLQFLPVRADDRAWFAADRARLTLLVSVTARR